MKTAKYGKGQSIYTGMVPAKQLHLPVMGVSMLPCNIRRLHGHFIPTSRDSVQTNKIQSVASTTKLKNK
jgi:hypothetical protein